jgi:hypothetical protein
MDIGLDDLAIPFVIAVAILTTVCAFMTSVRRRREERQRRFEADLRTRGA